MKTFTAVLLACILLAPANLAYSQCNSGSCGVFSGRAKNVLVRVFGRSESRIRPIRSLFQRIRSNREMIRASRAQRLSQRSSYSASKYIEQKNQSPINDCYIDENGRKVCPLTKNNLTECNCDPCECVDCDCGSVSLVGVQAPMIVENTLVGTKAPMIFDDNLLVAMR